VLQVRFGADLELSAIGKISQRFGITFGALIELILQVMVVATNLLFKK